MSAEALGVIGGFNILGSLFFGWAGGRWNKLALLGGIYLLRSLALGCYFAYPPSAGGTLVFAAVMGFLWLGVAPLVAGAVADLFGLRWQAMLQGVAFVSHQLGSFLGAFGGGLILRPARLLYAGLAGGHGARPGRGRGAGGLRAAADPAPADAGHGMTAGATQHPC